MKHPPLAFDTVLRFASMARCGLAASVAFLVLAIALGTLGLDRDGTMGKVIFPVLGVTTLLGAVGAFVAGLLAVLREHDRSIGTVLTLLAGVLLASFMIAEVYVEG